jgi:type IV pilus assembly protein PilC
VIPVTEQAVVFRELATLVGAGISLVETLGELSKRPLTAEMRNFLATAQTYVSHGRKLSEAMRSTPGRFSELTISLVEAGEEGGRLEEMLRDAAMYLERDVELRRMVARETFYPKILLAACLFIPLATKVIVAGITKNGLAAAGVLFLGLLMYAIFGGLPVLALYAVYRSFSRSETGRDKIDAMKLGVPVLGGVVERLALLKLARALGALYAAGVSWPKAVGLAADAAGNRCIGAEVRRAVPEVEKGKPLSEALAASRLKGSLVLRLLATGEKTGNVDEMVLKAADHYADETETQIKRMSVMIVPVAVILMGVVVGIMMARAYGGYFSALLAE